MRISSAIFCSTWSPTRGPWRPNCTVCGAAADSARANDAVWTADGGASCAAAVAAIVTIKREECRQCVTHGGSIFAGGTGAESGRAGRSSAGCSGRSTPVCPARRPIA